MSPHPTTGRRYLFVFSEKLAFSTVELFYRHEARARPWMAVVNLTEFALLEAYLTERDVVVAWDHIGTRLARPYRAAYVYTEALSSELGQLRDEHQRDYRRFLARANYYDAVIVRSPWSEQVMRGLGCPLPIHVIPSGFSPALSASPRPGRPYDLAYWGSTVGRRQTVCPAAAMALGDSWRDLSGRFGRELLAHLELHTTAVYIAHSDCGSGPEVRPFIALAAGVAYAAEEGQDLWPFAEATLVLPRWTADTASHQAFVARLYEIASAPQLAAAEALRAVASDFTVERAIDRIVTAFG